MKANPPLRRLAAGFLLSFALSTFAPLARSQSLEILHTFEGSDGALPYAALVEGSDGNFYGTTEMGGDLSLGLGVGGLGTVFKMTPDGTLTTLVLFEETNGASPRGALAQGSDGNFYGTTAMGGDLSSPTGLGYGTVFKMTPDGTLTTLVFFNGSNGALPNGGLVQGNDGNFYGTTGGINARFFGGNNFGTVFKITPDGALTTLVRFNGRNGAYPYGKIIQGMDGNFYGITSAGGAFGSTGSGGSEVYGGTVFKMTPGGTLTTLVSFDLGRTAGPDSELVQGRDSSFYGIIYGAANQGTGFQFQGTVFKLSPDGALTTLAGPNVLTLMQARDGNFYGVTIDGSTVFQMNPNGAVTPIISIPLTSTLGVSDGGMDKPLVQGSDGNFYGMTPYGGDRSLYGGGLGTVFRIVMPLPPPALEIAQNGNQLILSWPTNAVGATLQTSPDLTNWTDSILAPVIIGAQNAVADSISTSAQFYRLKQ